MSKYETYTVDPNALEVKACDVEVDRVIVGKPKPGSAKEKPDIKFFTVNIKYRYKTPNGDRVGPLAIIGHREWSHRGVTEYIFQGELKGHSIGVDVPLGVKSEVGDITGDDFANALDKMYRAVVKTAILPENQRDFAESGVKFSSKPNFETDDYRVSPIVGLPYPLKYELSGPMGEQVVDRSYTPKFFPSVSLKGNFAAKFACPGDSDSEFMKLPASFVTANKMEGRMTVLFSSILLGAAKPKWYASLKSYMLHDYLPLNSGVSGITEHDRTVSNSELQSQILDFINSRDQGAATSTAQESTTKESATKESATKETSAHAASSTETVITALPSGDLAFGF